MELPLPDVPVCKRPHKDEGLMQPVDQLSQPPQVVSSCDNRILALVCFLEIKEEQNSWSPMGIFRISILGLTDFFMHNGNMSRPCRLNTSHLGRLTIIPRAGPSQYIIIIIT